MTTEVTAINPLDTIAADIHTAWSRAKDQQISAFDRYIAVGSLLRSARNEFTSNQDYGRWFAAQNFGFTTQWAARFRAIADREADARVMFETAVSNGDAIPGVNALIAALNAPPPPIVTDDEETTDEDEADTTPLAVPEAFTRLIELLRELARVNYDRDILPLINEHNHERIRREARRANRVVQNLLIDTIVLEATTTE